MITSRLYSRFAHNIEHYYLIFLRNNILFLIPTLQWYHNLATWRNRCRVSLVKFSFWSKFHVNIMTGFGVMTIFVYKGLTRNPEIENTPIWVLPNIWKLEQVRNTKFGTKVSNLMLLNAAKYHGYSFYHFWVIKGKLTRDEVKLPPPLILQPWLGLKKCLLCFHLFLRRARKNNTAQNRKFSIKGFFSVIFGYGAPLIKQTTRRANFKNLLFSFSMKDCDK